MKTKFVYTGIRVKNLDESIKFYTEILGMKLRGRNKIEKTKGEVAELVTEGGESHPLELNYYEPGSEFDAKYSSGEGLDHLAFQVENIDRFLKESTKAGCPAVIEIKTDSGNRWAYITDPNGILIEILA